MHKKVDLFYTLLHVPVDIIALLISFIVSYWIRADGVEIYKLPYDEYLAITYWAIPIWIAVFMLQGMYTKRYLFGTLQNLSHLIVSNLAGWASFVVFMAFLKTEQTVAFPRLMLIYLLLLSFASVLLGRIFIRIFQMMLRSAGIGRRRTMILGAGQLAELLEQRMLEGADSGMYYTKRIDPENEDDLTRELKKYKIDDLIIADHSLSDTRTLEYIMAAQNLGVTCHMIPNMFEVQSTNVLFNSVAGLPLLTFRQTPLDGWGRIVKRAIDIMVSAVGLVVLSPLFLLLSLIIMVTDPGPTLYRQKRLGRGGKFFSVFKFRSMRYKYCTTDNRKSDIEIFREMGREDLVEEWRRDQKVKDDPRISPLGKFMRKTRLDELPQLYNVLRGDLSLVGPRPIRDEELNRYGRWGSYLLSIKPGLTGLWQVSGGNDVSYDKRVELDAHYVQHWSLSRDFIILIKTLLTLLKGGKGY